MFQKKKLLIRGNKSKQKKSQSTVKKKYLCEILNECQQLIAVTYDDEENENVCRSKVKNEVVDFALKNGLFAFGDQLFPHKIGGSGAMHFISCSLKKITEIIKNKDPIDILLHEIIFDHRITKPVFDIEVDRTSYNSDLNFRKSLYYIIEKFVEFFHLKGMTLVDIDSFVVLIATRKDKYSSHIILTKHYVFCNVEELLFFTRSFMLWLITQELKILKNESSNNTKKMTDEEETEGEDTKERISILIRRKFPIQKPSSATPFSTIIKEKSVMKTVIAFDIMIDIDPLEHKNGTLRMYYSTKPNHERDKNYRLRYVDTQSLLLKNANVSNLLKEDLIDKCLTQSVFTSVDNVQTYLVQIPDLKIGNIMNNIKKLIGMYSFTYYEQNEISCVGTMEDEISYTMLKTWLSGKENVYKFFKRLSGFKENQISADNIMNSFYNNDDISNICMILLHKHNNIYDKLYLLIAKTLLKYGSQNYIQSLFDGKIELKARNIKISKSCKFLSIIVFNGQCEIIRTTEKRNHLKNEKGAIYYKINIENGTFYQRCKKSKCSNHRGKIYLIDNNIMKKIREETSGNFQLNEFLNTQK